MAGGTRVELEEKKGVVHKRSKEAEAYSRWQHQEFRETECMFARGWRDALGALDLWAALPCIKQLESAGLRCSTLEEAPEINLVTQSRPSIILRGNVYWATPGKLEETRAALAKGVAAPLSGPPAFKCPRQRTPICLRKPT